MLAASFQGNGKLEIGEIEKPLIKNDDGVLIRVDQ